MLSVLEGFTSNKTIAAYWVKKKSAPILLFSSLYHTLMFFFTTTASADGVPSKTFVNTM